MSTNTRPTINRRTFLAASLLSVGALAASPRSLFAAVGPDDTQQDRFTFTESGNTLYVVDNQTGETATAVFDWANKSATVTYSNGTVDHVSVNEQGDVYIDGELALGATQVPTVSTRAVPSGFIPLLTQRHTLDTMKSQFELITQVVGIMLAVGVFLSTSDQSLTTAIYELIATGVRYGYLEVKQYYNPNTYYVYTVATLYRNSNYTGVIWRGEFGPMPHS